MATRTIPLYTSTVPNSIPGPDEERTKIIQDGGIGLPIFNVRYPTLTIYPAETTQATKNLLTAGVLICPGGGYNCVVIDHEGTNPAKAFQKAGITAFVLKYRLPSDKIMQNKTIGPLQDAQQALKIVAERAKEWNVDPKIIGIIGFSAGGHLASTAATHFDQNYIDADKGVIPLLRPNFQILVYPVVLVEGKDAHMGSANNLLGKNPTEEQKWLFSNDKQITMQTPQTMLVHAADDEAVPVGNSFKFFEGLNERGLGACMHVYQNGGHGFGMVNETSKDDWFRMVLNWMEAIKVK